MKYRNKKNDNIKTLKEGITLISGEFKTIKAIDMTFKAKNVLEKLFWALVGCLGLFWVVYFIHDIVQDHNPITITKGKEKVDFR